MAEQLMAGRVALVTGASRGIGAATARLLAKHGAAVGVNYYRSDQRAEQVVSDIRTAGGTAIALQADVRDERQVAEIRDRMRETYGPVDALVINAVTNRPDFRPKPLVEHDSEEVAELTGDQLRLCLTPLRAIAPEMAEHGGGSITAIGSHLAAEPATGMGSISVAKSAMSAAIRTLALELGPQGIRVNTVAPGMVLTELNDFIPERQKAELANSTALRRNATPEDVAGAVLMMAGEHAGFVSGSYLPVHGGGHLG